MESGMKNQGSENGTEMAWAHDKLERPPQRMRIMEKDGLDEMK